MGSAHVLVVDDERSILDVVERGLTFAGHQVTTARNGAAALALVAELAPDLVVLDVMLPDIDGFEVCRRLRADNELVPVIFLTARDADRDIVGGFATGADDYLVKPFRLGELTARVAAVLRRTRPPGGDDHVVRCGAFELDERRHVARADGGVLDLTPTEFRLLRYLAINAGIVLSKQQILDHVWGPDALGDGNRVESAISYLRKKLGPHADALRTVRGVGYSLGPPT